MPTYTPWTWSQPHGRHYSYLIDENNVILDTLWSGPAQKEDERAARHDSPAIQSVAIAPISTRYPSTQSTEEQQQWNRKESDAADVEVENHRKDAVIPFLQLQTVNPYVQTSSTSFGPRPHSYVQRPGTNPHQASNPAGHNTRASIASLPPDVQADIGYLDRRFIQTGPDRNATEHLDSRYRRVARPHHQYFFVTGRVFKMLWTEPAGQANPGKTRNSTHFSTIWCGEQAYSEIRRFVVVRNKGSFSQCVPIQTYKGMGATKKNLIMHDHGAIHTSISPPDLLPGENLNKYSIRVEPTGTETLEPTSRVNYGKAYVVEHNVKVLDIGIVVEGHRYLISAYFDNAMRGE